MSARRILFALLTVAAVLFPTVSAVAADDDHTALVDQYTSLSGAMVNLYAQQSGQNLEGYLASQKLMLAGPGTSSVDALPADGTLDSNFTLDLASASQSGSLLISGGQQPALGAGQQLQSLSATSLADLNKQLATAGVALDTAQMTSVSELATAVTKSARTLDGAVTLAAAQWAQDLGTVRMPGLKSPGVRNPGMPTISADALPFGLLMNKSLATMVTNSPNLIASAKTNGLGQPGMLAAWNKSMASAYAATSTSLNSMLASPCVGDMMAVMASGSKASATATNSGTCASSCFAAGQYLHNSAGALFNNQMGSMSSNKKNPVGGVLNQAALNGMSTWAQGLVKSQNPQLTGTSPFAALNGTSASCGPTVSGGAKQTAQSTLPGVFAGLMK